MALTPGTHFGPFEIVAPLGRGGMGEVYRARDTRLNREVALKLLLDAVALDPERLARFTREAQLLASLSHSNIGAIYGLEHSDGQHALVLELIEGPTLADRVARGPVPIEEALAIAKQIAEAVEAAHAQGIIHRDLKLANIKVRPDGTVKVLDFGLAKGTERAQTDVLMTGAANLTASPTLLSPAMMTTAGVILGTAAYMAPEQARGKAVDHRADIWAFGCVLFEMLTGRRAFEGDIVTDTLAGVLRGEPEWTALPAETPRSISRLLRRCLEKDPRNRLQSIGDARLEIADALSSPEPAIVATAGAWRRWVPWVAAALIALAAIVVDKMKPQPATTDPHVTRSLIALEPFDERQPPPPGQPARPRMARQDRTALALSPDGRTLVFRAWVLDARPNGGTQSQLFVRALDSLTPVPIATTTGSENPFFSPDGKWIAYWDGGEIRRVPSTGGDAAFTPVTKIADGARLFGASWGDDDRIVFATATGLWRVPASGGTVESIAKTRTNENARLLPYVLPGSRAVLFTVQWTPYRWDDAQVLVHSLTDNSEKVLLSDAADARYVSSGHLVFIRRGKLMAAPFDIGRMEVTGPAVAIVDDVMQAAGMPNSNSDSGAGQFAVAVQGTLAYVTGGVQRNDPTELVWIDRDGGPAESVGTPLGTFGSPRVSPDGRQVLMFSGATPYEGGNRLWVFDFARRTHVPLTAPDERILWGVWSPDGQQVVYEKLDPGRGTLYARRADGSGGAQQIAEARPAFQTPGSWSRTGKLAFVETDTATGLDIRVLDIAAGDRTGTIAVQTAASDSYPEFSPDGKWLAYASDTSGRFEVYVQPLSGSGSRILVSIAGGVAPVWRRDGGELYYYWNSNGVFQMYAASISMNGTAMTAGTPRELFKLDFSSNRISTTGPVRGYDVTPDGRRFLFFRAGELPPLEPSQLVLVTNWMQELKQKVK